MRWLLSIALLASACSEPATRDVVTPPVDATDRGSSFTGGPLTYVIDLIDIDPTDDPSVPHSGFDLDNLYSDGFSYSGCYQTDFLSDEADQNCPSVDDAGLCLARPNPGCRADESGCRGGVDNQLPLIALASRNAGGVDLQSAYRDSIQNHRVVLVVRVTDVDDLETDSSVRVAIYRAFPTFSTGCDSVQADRVYSIAAGSLAGGLDVDANAVVVLGGSIRSGRLDARGATSPVLQLPLPLWPGYDPVDWPVASLRLRADVTATELRRVNFGGSVPAHAIAEAAAGGCLSCYGSVRMVIGGWIDLQDQGTCERGAFDPWWHGRLGIGFAMHAIVARISSEVPVATRAAPGTCGSSAARDQ